MQIGMQPLTHQHQTAGVSDEDKNALLISSNRLLPRIPPRIIQDQVSVFTSRYEEYDQVRVTKAAVAILIEQKKHEDPVLSTFYPTKSNKQVLASGAKNLMAITWEAGWFLYGSFHLFLFPIESMALVYLRTFGCF